MHTLDTLDTLCTHHSSYNASILHCRLLQALLFIIIIPMEGLLN